MDDDRKAGDELFHPIQLYVLQTLSLVSGDNLLIYIKCWVSRFQVTSKQLWISDERLHRNMPSVKVIKWLAEVMN